MVHKIYKEIEPTAEAMSLLWAIGSRQSFAQRKAEIAAKKRLNERCVRVLGVIEEIETDTARLLSDCREDVDFYFGNDKEDHECLAGILFLWQEHLPVRYRTPEEWAKSILEMDEAKYWKELTHKLSTYNENVKDSLGVEAATNLSEMMCLILGMDISNERKLQLQDIILNREQHFRRVCPLLHAALAQLEKYKEKLDALIEEYYAYWTKELAEYGEEGGFPAYLGSHFHVGGWENERGWTLRPRIFFPIMIGLSLSLDTDTEEPDEPLIGNVGILYGDGFDATDFYGKRDELSDEQVVKLLRLIGEKNKLEILTMTKDTPAYGSMLAAALKLTTATVSHHTNELYQEGLLNLEQVGKRVYYQNNKETIEKLIAYLQKKLL